MIKKLTNYNKMIFRNIQFSLSPYPKQKNLKPNFYKLVHFNLVQKVANNPDDTCYNELPLSAHSISFKSAVVIFGKLQRDKQTCCDNELTLLSKFFKSLHRCLESVFQSGT